MMPACFAVKAIIVVGAVTIIIVGLFIDILRFYSEKVNRLLDNPNDCGVFFGSITLLIGFFGAAAWIMLIAFLPLLAPIIIII